ncbi:hypothetical protein R0J87_21510, partial [Halomonas sp. SIMBA_159]
IIRTKNTEIGYLHQIPAYPGYTVYEVLNESFSELHGMQSRLRALESQLASGADERILRQYGELQEQFMEAGGYETESKIAAVANGLG